MVPEGKLENGVLQGEGWFVVNAHDSRWLHNELLGITPPEDWVTVDETLAAELRDRLIQFGYDGELGKAFNDWAGTENLEERVDGIDRIDPVVLAALRKQSG